LFSNNLGVSCFFEVEDVISIIGQVTLTVAMAA